MKSRAFDNFAPRLRKFANDVAAPIDIVPAGECQNGILLSLKLSKQALDEFRLPAVVERRPHEVLAMRHFKESIEIDLRRDALRQTVETNTGIALRILLINRARAVGRRIVGDDDLEIAMR